MRTLPFVAVVLASCLLLCCPVRADVTPEQIAALNALSDNCGLMLPNASGRCTCELDLCLWDESVAGDFGCKNFELAFIQNSRLWTCGTLPTELAALTHLETLTLTLAMITPPAAVATMPVEWGQLKSLKKLYLTYLSESAVSADRIVQGTLPTQWANMTDMKDFVLMNWGAVSGTLPSEWASGWRLQDMGRLVVQSVALTGTLPTELAPMIGGESFSSLIIRDTRISGTLPSQYANKSPSLLFLNLPDNYLSGTVPQAFSSEDWMYSMVDFVGNQWTCPIADPTLSDHWSPGFGQLCATCAIFSGLGCPVSPGPVVSFEQALESCFVPDGATDFAGVACTWGSGLNKRDPTFQYYEGCVGTQGINLFGSVSQHCNNLIDCARNFTGLSGQCTDINATHSMLCVCGGGGGATRATKEHYKYHFGLPIAGFIPIMVFLIWLPLVVVMFWLVYVVPLFGFWLFPLGAWRVILHGVLRAPGMLFHLALWFAALLTWAGLGSLSSAISGPAVKHDIHAAEIGSSIVVAAAVVSSIVLVACERSRYVVLVVAAVVCTSMMWLVVTIVPLSTVIPGYKLARQVDHYAYACEHRATYAPDSDFSGISHKRCNDLSNGYNTYALGVSLFIVVLLLQIVVTLVVMVLRLLNPVAGTPAAPAPHPSRPGYGTLPEDSTETTDRPLMDNAAANQHY